MTIENDLKYLKQAEKIRQLKEKINELEAENEDIKAQKLGFKDRKHKEDAIRKMAAYFRS